jgi:hypothetical protein
MSLLRAKQGNKQAGNGRRKDSMTTNKNDTHGATTSVERQDWGILRTGHVASTFHGTRAEAEEHVRSLNSTDEQGSSEVVTVGMTLEQSMDWLANMQ